MITDKKINKSRREFIRNTSLGTAGMMATGGVTTNLLASSKAMAADSKTVISAAHWGPLGLVVEDGKIVKSGPAIPAPLLNELQDAAPIQVSTKARVKYPMVRKGYLENPGNSDTSKRGKDEWVRVSWDKALELVHGELSRLRKDYGASSIFAGSYGWYSTGSLHKARTLLQRYMNVSGGFVGVLGDYSTAAAQVIMPHVMGSIEVYEQQTSWDVVLDKSDIIVLWSANPLTTLRIAWTATDQQGIKYFKKLKESGKRIICIDPVRSETCKFLDAEWLPINTATDVPLMLAMAHTLIVEGKKDDNFLNEYTTGYEKFEPYVLGKAEDGVVKDAKWASKITGVPEKVIKQLALDFVNNRTMFMAGWGMQRQQHGEQPHWMLATLASMIGQIGLPGGGFGLSYHYSNGGAPTTTGGIIRSISASPSGKVSAQTWLDKSSAISIPVTRITDALLNPGKTIPFNGTDITYPDIKFIYWSGGNPVVHQMDTNLLSKAFQKPDTIVVNEIYWTPTARMADIVLPATTTFERNDLTMTGDYSMMNIVPMKKAIEPQYESKNDYDIFAALAKLDGLEEAFTEGKTEMEWLKDFYQTAYDSAKIKGVKMPKFEAFWEASATITFTASQKAKEFVRHAEFREDPLLNPLGTPSGRIEIFSETIANMHYNDCKGHPTWMEPDEYAGNTTKESPLAIVTPHPYYRLHSQLCFAPFLREKYTVSGREPVTIHPDDAKARGIVDGDIVRLFNKRGQVLAGAVVSDSVIKGTVMLHEGAWYNPDYSTKGTPLCKFGCPNVLTMSIGTSKLAQGDAPNTAILQAEKFIGEAPEVTVFEAPKFTEMKS